MFDTEMAKEDKKKDSKAEVPDEAKKAADAAAKPDVAENGKPEESSKKPAEPEKPSEPDWKSLYALTLADFDNYKKRAARDREDTDHVAEADILKDVLPAVDNLQLALANAKEKTDDPFVKGVQLVYDTLLESLKKHGAVPFDSVGKELDTEKMEAIATLPSADVAEGKVSIESKRGWMLGDRVLRPAQVVVSSGGGAAAAEAAADAKPDEKGGKAD